MSQITIMLSIGTTRSCRIPLECLASVRLAPHTPERGVTVSIRRAPLPRICARVFRRLRWRHCRRQRVSLLQPVVLPDAVSTVRPRQGIDVRCRATIQCIPSGLERIFCTFSVKTNPVSLDFGEQLTPVWPPLFCRILRFPVHMITVGHGSKVINLI